VSVYPESKDLLDPGVHLQIRYLSQEGAVRAAGPWIPRHCHLQPSEWLDTVTDESAKEVCDHQPILEWTPKDIVQGLQLAGIFLSHPVHQLGWMAGRLTVTTRSGALVSFLRKNHSFTIQPMGWRPRGRSMGQFLAQYEYIFLRSPTPWLPHLSLTVAEHGRSSSTGSSGAQS
jgi:hypothetical protein